MSGGAFTDLKDKQVLVTGAGQGIGNALCKELYAVGAKVIAVSRTASHLEELKKECPKIETMNIDLKDWQKTREALKDVPELDGLVNNAGVAVIKPFSEMTEKDYDHQFDVNIKAVFHVTQTLEPKLREGASIVNIASLAASRAFCGHTVYSATKAAVDSLTRSLALELGDRKIRCNSVNPTVVLTSMGRQNWSDPNKSGPLLSHIPLRRFCEVPEVVNSVMYLLSNKSSFVNGHHLNLEGGYSVT